MSTKYSSEFLVEKFYTELQSLTNNSKKIILEKPQVSSANKKTFIANFKNICSKLSRQDEDVRLFFEKELNAAVSINGDGVLVITGVYKQAGILQVMTNYLRDYVTCKECNSCDTNLIKENRVTFLQCNKCLSKKALLL